MPEYQRHLDAFKTRYPPSKLAPLLAILVALTPFAIDAYLPAIPAMATEFGVSIHLVEASVPTFLFGFALGQLVGGPVSDNYGRKCIGMAGLGIFTVASVLIALAESAEQLLALRFVQAFGGGFAVVISSAIVRDLYDGRAAARVFSLIGLIMMGAPLIAPAVGSTLLNVSGWRMIFVLLAVYAAALVFVVLRYIPETSQLRALRGKPRSSPRQVAKNYATIFSHPGAMGYLLCQSFIAGGMFVFLTESSFAYIEYFAVSTSVFPILFGANIITMMILNRVNVYLLRNREPEQILKFGIGLQASATLLLLLTTLLMEPRLEIFLPLIMLSMGCMGMIGPNNMACYMSWFPDISGTANAFLGTSQFALGAVMGIIVSHLHNGTLIPMTAMMFLSSFLAILALWVLSRHRPAPETDH